MRQAEYEFANVWRKFIRVMKNELVERTNYIYQNFHSDFHRYGEIGPENGNTKLFIGSFHRLREDYYTT